MSNPNRISRRAAIVGAAASTAALAVPAAAAERSTTLLQLAMKFRDEAIALDPSIEGFWVGFDETMAGTRDERVQSVYFTRSHAPFVRKTGGGQ